MMDFNISGVHGHHFNNMSTDMPEPPLYIVVIAAVMYGLTFLLGMLGNISIIIIVCKFTTMRSRMNYFLVNLSIADLFTLLVCIPSAAVDLMAKEAWHFGEAMCKIVPFLESVVTLSSVLTILAITWDRYKGICYPLQYSEDKSKRMVSPFIFIWSVSILASIPLFFVAVFRDSHFRDGTPIKVCRMPITHTWHLLYFISIFTVFFCVMFFVMLYFTVKIFRTLAHRKLFIKQSADRYAKKILHERRQMIRLMVVVVIMFFVCLVPQRAISLWLIFASKIDIMSLKLEGYLLLKTFPRVLVYMNSAINPIIYNFTSTKFKIAFKNVLSCRQKLYKSVKQRMRGRLNSDVTELTGVLDWKSGLQ